MQQEFKLGQLEALLFAAGEPLGVPQLAELLGLNKPQTWELLGQLQEEYNTEKTGPGTAGSGGRLATLYQSMPS